MCLGKSILDFSHIEKTLIQANIVWHELVATLTHSASNSLSSWNELGSSPQLWRWRGEWVVGSSVGWQIEGEPSVLLVISVVAEVGIDIINGGQGGRWSFMVVNAFISSDDIAGVFPVPLHPLLHLAARKWTFVVVPAQNPW